VLGNVTLKTIRKKKSVEIYDFLKTWGGGNSEIWFE